MSSIPPVNLGAPRGAVGRLFPGLASLLAVGCACSIAGEVPGADEAALPSDAEKSYNLYVGVDLEVPQGEAFFRMQRFTNYSAEIRVDGRAQRIPIRDLPTLRIDREMKLSRDAATLTGVKVKRAYSPRNDPFRRWASTQLSAPDSTATRREVNPNIPQPTTGPVGPGGPVGQPSTQFQITEVVTRETFSNPGADMSNASMFVGRSENEKGREGFDAIEAEFEVSSGTPLAGCYLLMICDFKMRERDEQLRRWIHLRTLGDITPKARKVRFLEGGLPPGFILVEHEFHLYAGERQIATNLSDKRIELSEDEAFTFLNLKYIGAHRGETLPPAVAWAEVPPELADRLPPDVLRWPVYVQVDAEGRAVSMAADDTGRRAVPQRVEAAVRTFRFNPALQKGKPVAGTVVLRIADFLPPLPE